MLGTRAQELREHGRGGDGNEVGSHRVGFRGHQATKNPHPSSSESVYLASHLAPP
jgi:hypothetical protein